MTTANPTLVVRSASIVALRLFDVAYAIDLTRVEGLWSSYSRASVSRGRLAYTPSKALAFDVPLAQRLEIEVALDDLREHGGFLLLHVVAYMFFAHPHARLEQLVRCVHT